MLKIRTDPILLSACIISALLFLKSSPVKSGYYYSRQFDTPERWINTDNLTQIGARFESAREAMTYVFPKASKERVVVKLLFGRPYEEAPREYKNIKLVKLLSADTVLKMINASDAGPREIQEDITRKLYGKTDFRLRLDYSPLGDIESGSLALRRVEVSVSPPGMGILSWLWLVVMSVSFLWWIIRSQRPLSVALLLFAVIALGAHLRWSELQRTASAVAHPDAVHPSGISYYDTAVKMRLFSAEDGFYAARDWHEPFHPLLIKAFFAFLGPAQLHLRFLSFVFSVLSIWLVYLAAKELFVSKVIAILSAAFIAINKFLIEQSVLGLRLELEICLLLLLFYFCYLKKEKLSGWVWAVSSGVIGGLWLLTKSYNLPVILFIMGYSSLKNVNWGWPKKIALFLSAALIAVAVFFPYELNIHKTQGKFFAYSSKYMADFANVEFSGKPGFPRERLDAAEYYFKLHTPAQFVLYQAAGIISIFYFLSEQIFNVIHQQNHLLKVFLESGLPGLPKYPFVALKVLFLSFITLLGIIMCMLKKNLRPVIYIIIIGNFANLFLYGATAIKHVAVIQTQRTIAQVLPFMAFLESYAVYVLFNKILRRKT